MHYWTEWRSADVKIIGRSVFAMHYWTEQLSSSEASHSLNLKQFNNKLYHGVQIAKRCRWYLLNYLWLFSRFAKGYSIKGWLMKEL